MIYDDVIVTSIFQNIGGAGPHLPYPRLPSCIGYNCCEKIYTEEERSQKVKYSHIYVLRSTVKYSTLNTLPAGLKEVSIKD